MPDGIQFNNSDQRFGLISITLHWTDALLMIGLIILGYYMTELTYLHPNYTISYTIHKSIGILVFELAWVQLLWTLVSYRPGPLPTHKPWQRMAAHIVHYSLLILMPLIAFSGFAISSAEGQAVGFFDWYAIPAFLPHRAGLADTAGEIHYYLAYGTTALIALHILAACKHQLIDKDGTISRMLGRRITA